ncbi:GntR family transcriptional regulator [Petroclostridium sp. X23]|uniref:FadR/GntR family transcriptional regulator n=1 Tax=Petroclostridium sp. X23 TaxID=3045146 RepID=UPI0024ADB5BC|nr:GntR family transcriptional regulator [Petroclostridium sp. X23]WHH60633.1 GntR family transcriptional regulator [Petroclostridium sp. X23]
MKEIRKVVVHEAVIEEILGYIEENNLQPGDKLPPERELVKLLKVSRSTIREVLRTLEMNHVIKVKHGSGIFIASLDGVLLSQYSSSKDHKESFKLLKQIAQSRLMLETFCAVEIAKTITPEQVHMLYEHEKHENTLLTKDESELDYSIIPGLALERLISSFLGNPLLNDFHKEIAGAWQKYFQNINAMPLPPAVRHEHHLEIIKAIESGSDNRIRKAIKAHLSGTISIIDKILSND